MKKILSFTVISLILFISFSACEKEENQAVSSELKEKNNFLFAMYVPSEYKETEITLRDIGTKCTVKGSCGTAFCQASVECGCDESPNCKCKWFECNCDCEKKGQSQGGSTSSLIVGMTEDQYHDALDFQSLLKQFPSQRARLAYAEFTGYLNAIVHANYTRYRTYGISTKNALILLSAAEKNNINQWFISHNFEERL